MVSLTVSERMKYRLALGVGLMALLFVVLQHAGIDWDAYMTFRVVDNAVYGYGLRWNIYERVQVYTHPLWMLLHIPFYALTEKLMPITLGISLFCTLEALFISLHTFEQRHWSRMLCLFFVPLIGSFCYIRFSVCGLENPLMNLLFAGFGWSLLKAPEKTRWFYMSVFVALSMFNRMDTIVIYVPVGLYLVATQWRNIRWGQCLLGSLPIVGWMGFSLFYYGFIFPNTKYAKISTGLPLDEYFRQGWHYLANLAVIDVIALVYMGAVALSIVLYALRRGRGLSGEMAAVAIGILAYIGYVILIGGDYIAGRFWSLPVFASVWWLYGVYGNRFSTRECIIGAVVILSIMAWRSHSGIGNQIADLCPACVYKNIKVDSNRPSLIQFLESKPFPKPSHNARARVIKRISVAVFAFERGPRGMIIDRDALGDALLARLPTRHVYLKTAGHFPRTIPKGYIPALTTGSLDDMYPPLAVYYEKLHTLISAPLWQPGRLREIIKFNLGAYDEFRQRYVNYYKTFPNYDKMEEAL